MSEMSDTHPPKKSTTAPQIAHMEHGQADAQEARTNLLLAALPEAELGRWLGHLEPVDMPLGHVLYESGVSEQYAYFPTTAIVSLLYVMNNGDSTEVAMVGNEGVVGISLFMGGNSTPSRAVVLSAGKGLRLGAKLLKKEFELSSPTMHLLLCYTQALITQMAQTAVCNRHHSLDQQLCRRLLLRLEKHACGCCAIVKHEYDRLLPRISGHQVSACSPVAAAISRKRSQAVSRSVMPKVRAASNRLMQTGPANSVPNTWRWLIITRDGPRPHTNPT